MNASMDTSSRYELALETLKAVGQEHLLGWWEELTTDKRDSLLSEVESIDWAKLEPLVGSHVLEKPKIDIPHTLAPATVYPPLPTPEQKSLYERATEKGEELIAAGKVAAFTVAGGQGTRLGIDGPKGMVQVTPVGNHSLFRIFASAVKSVRDKYGVAVPWYLMTSPANHDQTYEYLKMKDFYGLPESDVHLFSQAMLPAFDKSGKAILADKHRIALAPDGHGGSLRALVASGSVAQMQANGIEIISYFQVDNPLVKPFDPLFIGLHAITESEMSTKVSPKANDEERVGNVCLADGKLMVIEYSDFPAEYAQSKNADGSRKFDAGNLAIHAMNVDFVQRIVGETFSLPYRRAEKAVAYVRDDGEIEKPDSPNAIKLETFVFDALPLAGNPLVLEVDRAEEFSPVKNATGTDSLETSRIDQCKRACRWIEQAGIEIPRDASGNPEVVITIMPSFARSAEDVRERTEQIPKLKPGSHICLS